jgi:hypothetical protein
MMRLHGGAPSRYYLCRRCSAIREDVYREGAIVEHRWYDGPNGRLPAGVLQEAVEILALPGGEQLGLWADEDDATAHSA